MDCAVHEILQARILEWVPISCAEPGAMPWLDLPFIVCVHGCVVVIVCWYMYCVALYESVCPWLCVTASCLCARSSRGVHQARGEAVLTGRRCLPPGSARPLAAGHIH